MGYTTIMRIHRFGEYASGGKWVEFDQEYITYHLVWKLTYEGDIKTEWRDDTIIKHSQESLRYTIGNMQDGSEKDLFQYALDVMDGKEKDLT